MGDTIDDSLLKFLQWASKSNNKAIRIFLTGAPPPRAFGQLKGRGVDPGKIAINPMNHEDIERFIDVSINKVWCPVEH